jgi:putative FmdB family regulatory protein
MPLYEYECQACHRRTEKIQKFSDPELTVCPHCSGKLERTITAAAFSFAGGGWYKDGYASAKPSSNNEGSSSGSDTSSADTSSAAPAKPATASSDSTPSTAAPAAAAAPAAKP